jgi:hypothetical protein
VNLPVGNVGDATSRKLIIKAVIIKADFVRLITAYKCNKGSYKESIPVSK